MGDAAPSANDQRRDAHDIGDRAANRVFLSPRVLDETAFNEFADRLRAVLDDAGQRAADASAAAEAAAAERDELNALLRRQHQQMEMQAKLVTLATGKGDELRAVLKSAHTAAFDPASINKKLDAMLAERFAAFDAELTSRLDAFTGEISRRTDRLRAQADERASDAERDLERHAADLREQLTETLDAARRDALGAAENITADLARRLTRESAALEGLLATAAAARTELQNLIKGDGAVDITRLRHTCERAMALAGIDPATGRLAQQPNDDSLLVIADRADRSRREADAIARRLTGLIEDASRRAHQVGESVAGADAAIDAIDHRRARVESALDTARRAAADATRDLTEHAQAAERAAAPIADALDRIDAAADTVADLVATSTHLADTAEPLTRRLIDAVDAGRRLTSALDPWRPLLLDTQPTTTDADADPDAAQLPAPLAELVDTVRSSLLTDLDKMAGAMSLIADRAKTELRKPKKPGDKPAIAITPR
jgi:chromosome segregation ATPase